MDRRLLAAGLVLVLLGGAMNVLLHILGVETFRADLQSWVYVSYGVVASGGLLAAYGAAAPRREWPRMDVGTASKYFTYTALGNVAVAAAFALPILDPQFEFPILITTWPGIYIVIAYFSFVLVGVVGNAAWASTLRGLRESVSLGSVGRGWFGLQLILTEVGALGLAASMFLGGYVGADLVHGGGGPVTVGIAMEFAVIPAGVSIFLVIVGEVLGVVSILESLLTRRGTDPLIPS